MLIVDSSPLSNYNTLNDDSGLVGAANYAFANATKIMTITDASVLPAGHVFAGMIVDIYDKNGNSKSGRIAAAGGNVAIDLDAGVSLDLSAPVTIKVRVITDKNFTKTGSAYNVPVIADIAATAIQFEK
jgi:hypothetical protein